jgi:WD40 repeat protein
MRALAAALVLCFLIPSGCGSGEAIVTSGPRTSGSLAAEWPTAAAPRQAEFSRDGRFLAVSDASGAITIRETARWQPVARFEHQGGATSLAFSRDGTTLFTAGYDGVVRKWDVPSGRQSGELRGPTRGLWTLHVSPDGSRLAAGGEDGIVYLWTLTAAAPPQRLRGHERNIWEVRFSPDGKRLASGSFDTTTRLWDVQSGRLLKTLRQHTQAVVGLAYSPDGKLLATSGDDSTIRFSRASDGTPLRTIATGNHTYKLNFSSDGRWLASGGRARGGLGTLWHQLTGGGGSATPLRIWRVSDGRLVAALPVGDDIAHLAFSPDQHWLVSASEDKRVRLWRLEGR